MRKLFEIGICPKCQCSIDIWKTNNYKRFAKCSACGLSYAVPKSGHLDTSALYCPKNNYPILIIEKKDHRAYFWTDGQPCFSCTKYDKCEKIKDLIEEFTVLEVRGYSQT